MITDLPIKPNLLDFGIKEDEFNYLEKEKLRVERIENILTNTFFILTSIILTILFAVLLSTKSDSLPRIFQSTLGFIFLCTIAFISSFLFQIIVFPIALLNTILSRVIVRVIVGKDELRKIESFKWSFISYNDKLREYKEKLNDFWRNHPDSKPFGENLAEYFNEKEKRRLKTEAEKIEKLKQKHSWLSLSGYDFELEIAKIYKKMGYKVTPTKFSGDGGVDIILNDNENKMIILQCKNHKLPIGPSCVRELYGVMISDKASKAILICSGGFTKGVYSFVKGKNIELLTIDDVIQLHKQYSVNP